MTPAHLDHPDLRVAELAERLLEDVGGGHEVGVEDQHELAPGDPEPLVEGAGLEAAAVCAVQVMDGETLGAIALHRPPRERACLVGRVVEHLDLEQLLRVADAAHRVQQPVHHVHLVEDGELDRDRRKALREGNGEGAASPVPEVEPHHEVPVGAQDGQDDQGDEVQAEDAELEWAHGFLIDVLL